MAQFALTTLWQLEAPLEAVWDRLYDVASWPDWWPSVVRVDTLAEGDARGIGARRRLHWKTALPYDLSFEVAVTRIEVGMDLKNKTAELIVARTNLSARCLAALRQRCDPDKSVQHFPYPEIIDGAAEKHRGDFAAEVFRCVQRTVNAIHELHILS